MTRTTNKKIARSQIAKKTSKKTAAKKQIKKKSVKQSLGTLKRAVKKTKKTTAKKTKPSRKKPSAAKMLVCAADQQCFWVTDGQILKDLVELKASLQSMTNEVFAHHVTHERNDFADWVESVLVDAECAAALRRSSTRRGAQSIITRCLKLYRI